MKIVCFIVGLALGGTIIMIALCCLLAQKIKRYEDEILYLRQQLKSK